jgi:SAM-dependent methyltransferase
MDVVDLRNFYETGLGRTAATLITDQLRPSIGRKPEQTIMGLGYALPYLDPLMASDARLLAFMPARQGVVHWPEGEPSASALVDEFDLPLLESVVDLALVVHGLELSSNPQDMLQECWRVLAPQGTLVLIVPNRRGLWAAGEQNPFAHGQPFSRSQLTKLLKASQFTVREWRRALFMPPLDWPFLWRGGKIFDAFGRHAIKGFSGVNIAIAQKQVYAFSSGKRAKRFSPRLKPALLPQPARKDQTDI